MQWVLEGGHGASSFDELVLNRDFRGRITGLAYYGAQLVLAADDDSAIDALAVETRKHRGLRSFVGPQEAIAKLWARVQSWHPPPAIVRAHQPVYALTREALAARADVAVRPAAPDEAELVAEHSAEMILQELGYDPRANRAGFTASVRRAITLGLWWVWIEDGVLRFQCNIGPRSSATVQLQGVWTPPALRAQGYAGAALGSIARRLLEHETSISLYVNDFNLPAIALYRRLGFVEVGAFGTYLFA